jgi:soluble lytic murein transglycosylase
MVPCGEPFVKKTGRGYPFSMHPSRSAVMILLLMVLASCANPAYGPGAAAGSSTAAQHAGSTPELPPTITLTPTAAPDQRLQLGDRALLNGDYAAAKEYYAAALSAGAEPERAAFFLARSLYLIGDAPGALALLRNLIDTRPAGEYASRAYFLLGDIAASGADWASSVSAYQQVLILEPDLVADLVQERVGDALLASGSAGPAVQAYDAAAAAADPANALRLLEKEADTLLEANLPESAMALYERILASVTTDNAKARLNRKIGSILISLGRAAEGYERYQAALQYPTSLYAYLCLSDLVDAGIPVDPLLRGIIDYYAGQYAVAVDKLSFYLTENPAEPAKGLYFRGLAYLELGAAPNAVIDFEAAAALGPDTGFWDYALFEEAYVKWAYLEDYTGAVAVLTGLADIAPEYWRAAEALYSAGWIAELGGDLDTAARLWTRVAADYPADSGAAEARHLAGVALYRKGDYAGAEESFRYLVSSADGWTRSRALFWTAKALEKRGDSGGSRRALEQAEAASPTDYYSERAGDLLAGQAAFTRSKDINLVFDLDAEYQQAEVWVQSVFSADPPMTAEERYAAVKNDSRLRRGRLLWDLGLYDDAEIAFDGLWQSLANDPMGSLYLSRYLVALGYYPGAIRSARQVLNAAGLSDAQTLSAPTYFNHVRFGPYFMDLLVPQAVRYGFDPLFLFSIVRVESQFGVSAVSPASAHGLMQLIPSTAEDMAARLQLGDLSLADLYRPMINVQLGSLYLSLRRDEFDGDLFLALAGYNAGPYAPAEWKDLAGGDDDLLLECIPYYYEETRNYIRWIYENYVIYRDLYLVR